MQQVSQKYLDGRSNLLNMKGKRFSELTLLMKPNQKGQPYNKAFCFVPD